MSDKEVAMYTWWANLNPVDPVEVAVLMALGFVAIVIFWAWCLERKNHHQKITNLEARLHYEKYNREEGQTFRALMSCYCLLLVGVAQRVTELGVGAVIEPDTDRLYIIVRLRGSLVASVQICDNGSAQTTRGVFEEPSKPVPVEQAIQEVADILREYHQLFGKRAL